MAGTLPVRWRPPSFLKPDSKDADTWANIDLAHRNAYDQIYTVQDTLNLQANTSTGTVTTQAVLGTGNGTRMASGSASVTGSKSGIATGLTTVTQVVATIDNGAVGLNEWVSTSLGTPGTINIAVWKPTANNNVTPIASTTARVVRWIAIGT